MKNVVSGLLGLRNGFTSIGFPTDRYAWSDVTGKIKRTKEECTLPSSLFQWSSKWQVDFSTPNGVDNEGWQYAIDFPAKYHAKHNSLTDYVRRRRWCRKCCVKISSLWKQINQTHRLTSIALDQESKESNLLPENSALIWATDSEGFVLMSLVCLSNPFASFKWQYIPSQENFEQISIGVNLRIWGVDSNGNIHCRFGVEKKSNYCGTSWTIIEPPEETKVKFKLVSVGNDSVWAVSQDNQLFFRENITKHYPEGTRWLRIDGDISYISVNSKNEVYKC
jgi:tectonin beta-propeller repeat-containing protein 1